MTFGKEQKPLEALAACLLAGLLLAGCETTVDVDLPEHEPRLVANSLFMPDSLWRVRVTESKSIRNTNARFEPVDDATVEILQDGRVLGTLAFESDAAGPGLYASRTLCPRAGQTYTLRIAAPGFEPVEAEGRVPDSAAFTLAARRLDNTSHYEEPAEIDVALADPAAAKNYYALSVDILVRDQVRPGDEPRTLRQHVPFSSSDPVLRENAAFGEAFEDGEANYRIALFSDATFDGQTRRLTIRPSVYYGGSGIQEIRFAVSLTALSPDAYEYLRSEALADRSDDNPFAEPVEVFSNVHGGLGVFAGTNPAERAVALPVH